MTSWTFFQEIMMDHSLRSISYIADIGDLLVIMARRRIVPQEGEELQVIGATPKMICHVFESEEVCALSLYLDMLWCMKNVQSLRHFSGLTRKPIFYSKWVILICLIHRARSKQNFVVDSLGPLLGMQKKVVARSQLLDILGKKSISYRRESFN